jgi:hypothetical protein
MRRLRDESDPNDPCLAEAARLLQSTAPLERSEARRRRVRNALARMAHSPGPGGLSVRLAMATMLAVGSVAFAGAAIQHRWLVSATWSELPSVAASRQATKHSKLQAPHPTVPTATPAIPNSVMQPADVAPPPLPEAASLDHAARPRAPEHASPMRSETSASAKPVEIELAKPGAKLSSEASFGIPEADLVMSAMKALRSDGDPNGASALLDQYLRAHPDGTLAEEALGLSIEAAHRSRDGRRAAALGGRYIERYPNGRFTEIAKRVLDEATSQTPK